MFENFLSLKKYKLIQKLNETQTQKLKTCMHKKERLLILNQWNRFIGIFD